MILTEKTTNVPKRQGFSLWILSAAWFSSSREE
jgi:hypothetical protein